MLAQVFPRIMVRLFAGIVWRQSKGHASAQLYLGVLYANGKGVAKDYREAVRW